MNRALPGLALLVLLAGCASPPLRYYTLGAPAISTGATSARTARMLTVQRVSLPDYLDTQEITSRDDDRILRSAGGRWAERLSVAATALLAAHLQTDWPDMLVTTQRPEGAPPADRLAVTITRLDITKDGHGALDALWRLIPADPHRPIAQGQTRLTADGNATTDDGVVTLTRKLVDGLAARIATQSGATLR
ncbi:PqiC family protein [Acidomonas methanolica]|uniref:Outer membrane lipoprotein n=1 Tax=Acidomonas methanolica NBRC 104435 TaxID=1231351 RepID=A0A023D382_ACIMT|nr:PqiC family protein [Acidomonas methanolica]MBU2654101.1 PqiC family protein [Acidomonas methanolica]TCS30670.1 hypothetical protein EDC31_105103 [Acidomonas methanolica]GAJ28200.1 outer membrane lipoprotein [Acidomonas methanolica NBRC 104435]GBQ58473.1 outer membrane lipoprotein [Acidomonas methanolica]GEK98942.1 hypothetical protein AME01nite_14410 [Acidomonas methanolica NBRC 104435]